MKRKIKKGEKYHFCPKCGRVKWRVVIKDYKYQCRMCKYITYYCYRKRIADKNGVA